jgi:hypothetical protein
MLFFTLLFPFTACTQLLIDQTQSGARTADIAVQYHVWWRYYHNCPSSNPQVDWFHWVQFGSSDNACNFRGGTSWLRDASTTAYPLIGLYEGGDVEVVRWHIRVAKAAGITAFLATSVPGAPESENAEYMNKVLTMLRVASEENFKIGLEVWQPLGKNADYYANLKSNIDSLTSSPYASAIYRIDNLPVVWLVLWSSWDTGANLVSNLFNQRRAYYIWSGDLTITEVNSIRSAITNGSKVAQVVDYNNGSTTGCFFRPDVSDRLDVNAANGYLLVSHAYPYMNTSGVEQPPRYCLSNNGALLADFLSESTAGNARLIIIESWNDFIERHGIEPGMDINQWINWGQEQVYQGDPYRTLKQIAAWKGVEWHTPFLDCAIVDPVLQQQGMVECGTPIALPR